MTGYAANLYPIGCMELPPITKQYKSRFGPLEKTVLEILWERGSGTVREVREAGLQQWAYTTIMTTLSRLVDKKILERTAEKRAFRYKPLWTRERLQSEEAIQNFRLSLDSMDPAKAVLSMFVDVLSEHDVRSLDHLRALIEEKRRKMKEKGHS